MCRSVAANIWLFSFRGEKCPFHHGGRFADITGLLWGLCGKIPKHWPTGVQKPSFCQRICPGWCLCLIPVQADHMTLKWLKVCCPLSKLCALPVGRPCWQVADRTRPGSTTSTLTGESILGTTPPCHSTLNLEGTSPCLWARYSILVRLSRSFR